MISSPGNEVVRTLRRLGHERGAGLVLLEGPRVVREAAGCGVPIALLALRDGFELEVAAERTVRLSERAFASASRTVTPQGVLAVGRADFSPIADALAAARTAGWPLVVLDGLQDPGNVGAICRSAAAAGAPALAVLEGGADPLGPKAVRASAGNVFRLRVARGRWSDLEGVSGYAAGAAGAAELAGTEVERAGLIAFGGETRGVENPRLPQVRIPMAAGVESLNVAAAAAVFLFEISRRLAA